MNCNSVYSIKSNQLGYINIIMMMVTEMAMDERRIRN